DGDGPRRSAPRGGRRTAWTVAITATVTLAVAGILTWTVVFAYGPSTSMNTARGLPADDPCALLGEDTLSDLDAETYSWSNGEYSNGCAWETSMAGEDEVYLSLHRGVAFSETDSATLEAAGEEHAPRDPGELYETAVESASEVFVELGDEGTSEHQDRPLSYGDESVLVVHNIDYGYSDSVSQRVSLIVREGDVVSTLSFHVTGEFAEIDLNESEGLLTEAADDVFG
ncbi:hypothetical protein, partial [Nocardiopsis sp. JB363]|uniref:hypothetical protein n=1 Tax=Nocardiopsis sp. JB363 TaxID=1434837 RepID=UPI000B356A85